MIVIDGTEYKANWKSKSFKVSADIINGDESGRLQGTKDMYLDYVGTFFNTSGEIIRAKDCTDKEWAELYLTLANPINEHTVTVPFLLGTLTTTIYISKLETTLIDQKNGKNRWDNKYQVTFTTMNSQWLAGGELQGYEENILEV